MSLRCIMIPETAWRMFPDISRMAEECNLECKFVGCARQMRVEGQDFNLTGFETVLTAFLKRQKTFIKSSALVAQMDGWLMQLENQGVDTFEIELPQGEATRPRMREWLDRHAEQAGRGPGIIKFTIAHDRRDEYLSVREGAEIEYRDQLRRERERQRAVEMAQTRAREERESVRAKPAEPIDIEAPRRFIRPKQG